MAGQFDDIPTNIKAKMGICAAYAGNMLDAEKHFATLLQEKPLEVHAVYLDVGEYLDEQKFSPLLPYH